METSDALKKTPLYESHLSLKAKMAPFGGWMMPIQYDGILAEHEHTRNNAALFDICHMGEFMLEGDAKLTGLDRIVTQNICSMPLGALRYGFMLNEQGGVIDDLIVYRSKENSWMLVVNAATIDGDEANVRANLKGDFKFDNVSAKVAKLDLQGPGSARVITKIFGAEPGKLGYYRFGEFTLWGQRCIISRSGYTGELGFEIYISNDYVVKLWDLLLAQPSVKPAGLGCRDTLRLEMGYPLYGHELDTKHSPVAAGLDKFVDFSKDFIGKNALLKEREAGPQERLVYFKADSRRSPRNGFKIFVDGAQVGKVTSGSFSPSLSIGIGTGYVTKGCAIGDKAEVGAEKPEIAVNFVKKPFYGKTKV
jgi:aminomethyltransferase